MSNGLSAASDPCPTRRNHRIPAAAQRELSPVWNFQGPTRGVTDVTKMYLFDEISAGSLPRGARTEVTVLQSAQRTSGEAVWRTASQHGT